MSSDVLEEYADAKYRLRIEVDDYPDSPRRWGPLSVIVAWHSNYNFSDTDEYDTPQDFVREMKRVKQQFYPLYLMDHSSLTLRTEPLAACTVTGTAARLASSTSRTRRCASTWASSG
jgi:hypothetical protein